jgi:hypothetical protein
VRGGSALAFASLTLLFTPEVLSSRPSPPEDPPKTTSLLLRIEKEHSDTTQIKGLKTGIAQVVEFTLSNPLSGLAIIDELAVEVLDVIEDGAGSTQTVIASYKYPIELNAEKRGRVPFGDKFKYAPGEVDRIILGVFSDSQGYDYFVRIVVRWYDAASMEKRETVSDPMVLRFPAPARSGMNGEERGRLSQKQQERIEERLQQLQNQSKEP